MSRAEQKEQVVLVKPSDPKPLPAERRRGRLLRKEEGRSLNYPAPSSASSQPIKGDTTGEASASLRKNRDLL